MSRSDEKHPYTRGYTWWSNNAFWRDPKSKLSAKAKAYYEKWLDDMRASEKALTRLG